MAEEKVEQPAEQPAPQDSPKGFDDQFDAGWKKYEEEAGLASEQAAPTDGKPAEKKPIKVLKVQGKEVPIYSDEELVEFAQKGVDYTQKRQADSADRKKWEEEYQKKADELNTLGKKFNDIWDRLEKGKAAPAPTASAPKQEEEVPEETASVYDDYEIDPEFARPHEKKLIDDVVSLRGTIQKMNAAIEESSKALRYFQVKEVVSEMSRIVGEEREQHPFDDIVDDATGKSLTLQQFSSLMAGKAKAALESGQPVNLDALTRETVREISLSQRKSEDKTAISDEMNEEEFKAKYPKLASRLLKTAGQQAVDKHTEEMSKVPPSLDRRQKEVDLKKQPTTTQSAKSMSDQLDAAFGDPDILNALRGQ